MEREHDLEALLTETRHFAPAPAFRAAANASDPGLYASASADPESPADSDAPANPESPADAGSPDSGSPSDPGSPADPEPAADPGDPGKR